MITRRTFIKTTTLAAASTMLAPGLLKASAMKSDIGLQLYTVRDQISKDLPGTLKEISRIGYTWLEAAGYGDGKFYGLAPAEFKKMVNDLGMKMISSHCGFKPEESRQVIDSHLELGVSYIVCPSVSIPEKPTEEDYYLATTFLNEIGLICSQAGLKFGYHNHNFEFKTVGDTTGYDIILEKTDPKLVCFEADIYWMTYAGVNPVDYFKNYPGRFNLWHVKDMANNPEKSFAEIGKGTIPYVKYFGKAAGKSGMEFFFVEQDECKGDPMESIEISFNYLNHLLNK
jgi:sugar phosphate isomerase/epimerase